MAHASSGDSQFFILKKKHRGKVESSTKVDRGIFSPVVSKIVVRAVFHAPEDALRMCLDDKETLMLLIVAGQGFARATVPNTIVRSLAHMTVLRKKDGGVRGIATTTVFRRLGPRHWRNNS